MENGKVHALLGKGGENFIKTLIEMSKRKEKIKTLNFTNSNACK